LLQVEAVVKTLAKVTSEDPEAKCLVFSTWPDVLDILAAGQSTLAVVFSSVVDPELDLKDPC
jgi:hypothetical protein